LNNYALTIVLPCYNPQVGWVENILAELDWLKGQLANETIQLIIVNDGTTNQYLGESPFKVCNDVFFIHRSDNRGKGYSLREGVVLSASEKVIYTDIDFPYERDSFLSIYKALKQADVAIGVRSEDYYTNMPKMRVLISKVLRLLIRFFMQIPTDDTQCGLKGFNLNGKAVFLSTTIDRYLFDLEFIYLAARKNLIIEKVPVRLKKGIVLSKSNFGILSTEVFNFIKIFIRSRFSKFI
jgi:glycosyltransferase involved in cell wall biosynthesis